ncbi:MAG: hypothetical protein [Microviridae sp.]|nr:MAG: hypothetical protein [Microviridae sp.]
MTGLPVARKKESFKKSIRREIKKIIRREIPQNVTIRNYVKNKLENALIPDTMVRLESLSRRLRPRIYENKNLTIDKTSNKSYNPLKLNFRDESEICRRRKERRREIMRKTKGLGLRVRFARWIPDSYVYCR